jgi:signal transduction histidine kinase
MKRDYKDFFVRYGIAVLAVIAGVAARSSLTPFIGNDLPFVIFTLSVLVGALYGGFGPGLAATLLSVVAGVFFFLDPHLQFIPLKPSDLVRMGLFIIAGIIISYLSHNRLRRIKDYLESQNALHETETAATRHREKLIEVEQAARQEAEKRWRESELLQKIGRQLGSTLEIEKIRTLICQGARTLVGADGAAFVKNEGEEVFYAEEDSIEPLWKGCRFPILSCISGLSMIEHQAISIEDIYVDSRVPIEVYRPTYVKSLAVMPITAKHYSSVVGVYWAHQHQATTDELNLLQSLAAMADLALLNAESLDQARRAQAQAEEANKLKDEFLAVVSHELRTPLTPIVAWSELLLTSKELPEEQFKLALESILRNARMQTRLVDDLLDVSRMVTNKLELNLKEVDLFEAVDNAVRNLHPAAEAKQINLRVIKTSGEALIQADIERFQQIIYNLVSNAIKFTEEGGEVELKVNQVNSHCDIKIKDTGRGITPELLPRIFEKFSQGDRHLSGPQAGLGLGLAIVKSLVELHGGEIFAESDGEGKGSTFTLTIPAAKMSES